MLRASKAASPGRPMLATTTRPSATARSGDRTGPAAQVVDPAGPERQARVAGRPGGEGAAGHDEREDPGPGRRPRLGVEGGQGQERRRRRRRRSSSRRRARGRPGPARRAPPRTIEAIAIASDDRAFGLEVDQERRDRRVDPGERRRSRARRGASAGDDRQAGLGHGVGQARRPEVERDRPEPDRDGERRTRGRRARRRPAGRRARSGRARSRPSPRWPARRRRRRPAARGSRPSRRPGRRPAPSVSQDAEQAAGRRRQDRGPRRRRAPSVRPPTPSVAEGHRRGVAARARRPARRRASPSADQRAEDQEEAQVGGRRQLAAADRRTASPGSMATRGDARRPAGRPMPDRGRPRPSTDGSAHAPSAANAEGDEPGRPRRLIDGSGGWRVGARRASARSPGGRCVRGRTRRSTVGRAPRRRATADGAARAPPTRPPR